MNFKSITNEYPDEEDDDDDDEYKAEETAQSIKLQNVSLHLEFPVLNSLSLVIQENEKMGKQILLILFL